MAAPLKGWGTPGATSSPLSKVPPKSSLDDLDTAEPMVDPMVRVEDDDDQTFTPCKTDLSKSREAHRSSKQWGSPPAKKAHTESPVSQKTSKSKPRKMSHTSWDEREEREGSRKEPKYKDMCYLTFATVMKLEQSIFEKCSFDQPLMSHPSPLQGSDKPSLGSMSTYSKTTCWLQQSQSNIDHFWKEDTALVKALR